MLNRKMDLLKSLYEELNYHEFDVLNGEYKEPPEFYRDLTRLQIYECVEREKKKVGSLTKELRAETNARKCYEQDHGKQAKKIKELKGQLLSARKESSQFLDNANNALKKLMEQTRIVDEK